MKGNTDIWILSQPIRSGKTTALLQAIGSRSDIGGFLTPDVDGIRQLYHIAKNVYIPFEADLEEPAISIGKFRISQTALAYGNDILKKSIGQQEKYILIDEAGKLELQQNGFHEGISYLIQCIKQHPGKYKILMVVRDSLLDKIIEQYRIHHARIIDNSEITSFFTS